MSSLTLAICARNAQDIIRPCLDSIRGQTVAPDEVIVAVDEDDDPTAAVASAWGARVVVSHGTGLYEARNAVLDACTTDYLAFTDADCVLSRKWVECVYEILDQRPEVAAGTGRHPPTGTRNLASWLHHMWFVVETRRTGPTDGVIGGNSFFRTAALRSVGGWLHFPGHSAAEDVYISKALRNAGHAIWFDERVAAHHNYETRLKGLWRKAVMMGRDIVVMLRAAGWYDRLWWYTLAIPMCALALLVGLAMLFVEVRLGLGVLAVVLGGTLVFVFRQFGSLQLAWPRWLARWVLIWPYSWGILKGLLTRIPSRKRP